MVRNGFDDNRPLWAVELNALQSAPGSFGVVDGCTPTEGTGTWDVDVAPGTVRVDGTGDVSVSGQTVDLADPTGGMNAGETRVVLVTVDATGTASDTQGVAATNPASPDIPANEVLVGVVVVAAADASISDSDLYDPRVVINDGANSGVNADLLDGDERDEIPEPGIIAMWSGSIASIPSGWVLCDGNNGTPNLQDKFVVGAGSSYAVGDTGGESTHTLTEAELASHNHPYTLADPAASSGNQVGEGSGGERGGSTGSTGGDSAHENKPPYHALAYIQKV